jgi:hypothetical protein
MGARAGGFLVLLLLLPIGGATACAPDSSEPATGEDDFTKSDFPADQVLPYSGSWLDAPKALAGIGQFDRLKTTVHDDAKCSTMVAVAAAIVGGEERFVKFLDAVAKKRAGKNDDLAIVEKARVAVTEKRLTSRHINELTDVVVRAYDVRYGAYDEQIREMVLASGYVTVKVGSKKPQVLVDNMSEREVVPLSIMAPEEDGSDKLIPHITLLWKDARGVVRLYDSDDVHGSHVMPRGSAPYNDRMTRPDSSWDLGEKYR